MNLKEKSQVDLLALANVQPNLKAREMYLFRSDIFMFREGSLIVLTPD